jgi:hypothetical protein
MRECSTMEANDHGPDELYDKFRVYKASSGRELTGRGEFIFVLRPETNDHAARAALYAYADACKYAYPDLSKQILDKLEALEALENQIDARLMEWNGDASYEQRMSVIDRIIADVRRNGT